MDMYTEYYSMLEKPFFSPPSYVFGPVWTVLYVLIAIAFIKTLLLLKSRVLPTTYGLVFVINLLSNFVFTPIQFGLQNIPLASLDILIVLGTTMYLVLAAWSKARSIALLLLPYLLWVSFATFLQLSILVLNW